jgi:uncharacterized protein
MQTKKYLIAEFILFFVCIPTLVIVYRLAPYLFVFLWLAAAYCWLVERKVTPAKPLWGWNKVRWPILKPILWRFLAASVFMVLFIYYYDPERLFGVVRHKPEIVPFLLFLYPMLSALPQEYIYCRFFFNRYQPLFGHDKNLMLASAVVFAFGHMLFINWIAPTLSLFAGLIFAHTYYRHRSLALVTIEHGLYGNVLFLSGLGWYFYGGAVQ